MLYIMTIDEAKADLGIKDIEDDAVLTRLMEGLQGRFDAWLGRTLLRGEGVTEYFDGGRSSVCLARYPLETIASVSVDDSQDWTAGLLDSDEYRANLAQGRIFYGTENRVIYPEGMRNTRWPDGLQNIRVVYTGGYLACGSTAGAGQTVIDEAIRRAFALQIGFEWRNRLNYGQASAGAAGVNVTISKAALLPEVEDGLLAFKRF